MTILAGSKKDVLNQKYKNALSVQLVGLSTAEITADAVNAAAGTIYHNVQISKLQVVLAGAVETITSS